jgi:hypothetical protein
MKLRDINSWIHPPEDYLLVAVEADGNFIRLEYRQIIYFKDTTRVKGRSIVILYVNDFGREVLRTCDVDFYDPEPPPEPKVPVKPLTAWERVAFAFEFLIISLKEALCR